MLNVDAPEDATRPPATVLDRRRFLVGVGRAGAATMLGRSALIGVAGSGAWLGAGPAVAAAPPGGDMISSHPPDVIIDWYRTLYSRLMDEGTTPPPAARIYACAGIAAHEALSSGAATRGSLAGRLNGLKTVPKPAAGHRLDGPTVVTAAIATTMGGILSATSEGFRAALVEQFDTHIDQRRGAGVGATILQRSMAHGRKVGEHLASWAAGDGADATVGRGYTPPAGEGLWESTPPNFGTAIDPHWGTVRTMALTSADACAPPPPPAPYSTDPSSAFYAQAVAVLTASDRLTDEDRATALFWRDNPLTSGLPAGHWMLLAGQLAAERGRDLAQTARLHALTGITLADAFTSCWHEKYLTNLLRPISYIRAHVPGRDAWSSFVNTPQFPEYTSGHSVASFAVASVLTDQLGVFPFTDRTHGLRNPQLGTRSLPSFTGAAEQAANSRLLGGIHYPMGIEVGTAQGERVGRMVLDRLGARGR